MAIITNIEKMSREFVGFKEADVIYDYLSSAMVGEVRNRINNLQLGDFVKQRLTEDVFALEQRYFTKEQCDCRYEAHNQYIDIQLIVSGEEIIKIIDRRLLKKSVEELDKDVIFFTPPSDDCVSELVLRDGDIAVFFPWDAHMPCIQKNKEAEVLKTVLKVDYVKGYSR